MFLPLNPNEDAYSSPPGLTATYLGSVTMFMTLVKLVLPPLSKIIISHCLNRSYIFLKKLKITSKDYAYFSMHFAYKFKVTLQDAQKHKISKAIVDISFFTIVIDNQRVQFDFSQVGIFGHRIVKFSSNNNSNFINTQSLQRGYFQATN